MVSYGPWIQDDDYTAENETNAQVTGRWRTEYAEVDGPYGGVSEGTYTAMSLDRNNEPAIEPYTAEPSLGPTKFAFEWIQDIVGLFDPDGRSAIRKMREMYKAINASPYTDGVVYYWPGSYGSIPDGVIGIQWEGMEEPSFLYPLYAPAEVVGLTITGQMDAQFEDSMNIGAIDHLSPGSEFVVAVVAHPGEDWESGDEPPEPTRFPDDDLNDHADWDPTSTAGGPNALATVALVAGPVAEDYDVFGGQTVELEVDPGLLDPMGRVMLYTQMDFDTVGPLAAATVEQPPEPDGPGITGILAYGYHLSGVMTATWTLRPRPYRWIYGGAAPPLRRVQRNDRLGTGARNTPSSRQYSPRNIGYL